jgi:hypothetical protein
MIAPIMTYGWSFSQSTWKTQTRNVGPCKYLLPLKSRETAGKLGKPVRRPCGLWVLLVGSKELPVPQFGLGVAQLARADL